MRATPTLPRPSPPGRRKGSKESLASDAARKLEKRREQNREAQRRFRQRIKACVAASSERGDVEPHKAQQRLKQQQATATGITQPSPARVAPQQASAAAAPAPLEALSWAASLLPPIPSPATVTTTPPSPSTPEATGPEHPQRPQQQCPTQAQPAAAGAGLAVDTQLLALLQQQQYLNMLLALQQLQQQQHQQHSPSMAPAVHRGKTPRISTADIPASSAAVPAGTLTKIPAHFEKLLESPMGAPVVPTNQWMPREGGLNPPPIFLAVGGMEMLIDMMHEAKDDGSKAQGASAVFEACANNPGNQTTLANAQGQGMHVMVALLKNGTPELKSKAAQAIAAACGSNAENRTAVVQAGGIQLLISLLNSNNVTMQENVANALANVIKLRLCDSGEQPVDQESVEFEGLRQLMLHGGVQALMRAMKEGSPRVKEAATAAMANAMEFSSENRKTFQEAGGIQFVLDLLKGGDPHAQENATTALWNSMVDNEDACTQVVQLGGISLLVQQVLAGTEVGQELAAGAIWKACASDPSIKDGVRIAIPGLVQLLLTGTPGAKEHAAGAIRSACVNSLKNKEELNKCGGVEALLSLIRDGSPRVGEQAGAALANAMANCEINQITAAQNGGMAILVSVLDREHENCSEMVGCCVTALRNICVGNKERQEELGQLDGIRKLIACIPQDREAIDSKKMLMTSYVLGTLWKSSTSCEANREVIRAHFMDGLQNLMTGERFSADVKSGAAAVIQMLSSNGTSSPPEPQKPADL
uniref:BZIP domain-containing protein n=1 Tax=Hemiselmis andersenii TaxID=464988 RepID=A0A6U2A553_HEMAN|mmetsp:Transcript_10194/g.23857  ORF Transcript_10194/g.23857 Transcript_10194/m.23857 type:complete len:760 (+) Transcript_10194:196-2475(+)